MYRLLIFLKRDNVSLVIKNPKIKPPKQEVKSPYIALIHSVGFMPEILLFIAIAEPESPATRAWLSLVGIPKYHAPTDHITIENSAAHRAIVAVAPSSPKETMFKIVSVTELFTLLIKKQPRKLNIPEKITAFFSEMHLVVTLVATELGASVRPFTNITDSVKITVVKLSGDKLKSIKRHH